MLIFTKSLFAISFVFVCNDAKQADKKSAANRINSVGRIRENTKNKSLVSLNTNKDNIAINIIHMEIA